MATSFLAASHDALTPGSAKRKRSKPAKKQVTQTGPLFSPSVDSGVTLVSAQSDSSLGSSDATKKHKKQKDLDSSGLESPLSSPEVSRKSKKTKLASPIRGELSTDSTEPDLETKPVIGGQGESTEPQWTEEQMNMLISNIERTLPKKDNSKYSTQLAKVSWDDMVIEGKTADQCKAKWTEIMTKIRKFRTLTDLVGDAKEWVKHPWTNNNTIKKRHPDMPKKPLGPFFRFMMAKRNKYTKQNPGMSITEVAKLIGEKYKELNPKKKEQYHKIWLKEQEEYKEALEKFKRDHPELYVQEEEEKPKTPAAQKIPKDRKPRPPQNAMFQFVHHKMDKHMAKHPDDDKKEVAELYRKKYKEMKDSKKMVWIMKALEDKARFDEENAEYCNRHPEFQPKEIKFFITKDEQRVKDRQDGKPEKPPPNGYSLYTAETLNMLSDSDIPNILKMAEVARMWKNLSEAERQGYGKKAQEGMQEYRLKYEAYKEGLPEEERLKLEEEERQGGKKKKKSTSQAHSPMPQSRPQKPISAMFIFMKEKKDHYKKKNPEMSEKELNQHMIKMYNELSDHKKEKYKQMEAAHKAEAQTKVTDFIKKNDASIPKTFPGEPKRPPGSGYQLFSTDLLLNELSHIPSKDRMQEISKRWRQLDEAKKEEYKKKRNQLVKRYEKEVEKFKNKLSPEDRQKYEDYLNAKKGKTPVKKKAPAAAAPSTPEESGSESESSSSESESESDSDDDDEEEETAAAVQTNGPSAPTANTKQVSKAAMSSSSSSDSSSENTSDESSSSGSDSSTDDD
ncbi:nucleolar transcription factor 1-A isoform X2 [Lingula anatina]|uniref:Nucleolar transcription factor 1-A isoform X2 n=1 Tax=Lingula anatina TaxID=7574 RepID=A0A1S3KEH0_LINAN|nr:nucleolar transcription factor 1-A isoform X2 [Lingula anatina]|eukprot:XP_013420897.1 nucleolar transcription factor 1-A isoform X2 [Lingula anatina]